MKCRMMNAECKMKCEKRMRVLHSAFCIHHSAFNRRRRGFTFVEILAVIAILAGLWVLVLPAMGTRDDLRLGSAARVMIADLLYAQNRAISTQTVQFVSFTAAAGGSNGGYTIYDA